MFSSESSDQLLVSSIQDFVVFMGKMLWKSSIVGSCVMSQVVHASIWVCRLWYDI
jgi:hypothetical protein